MAKSKIGTGGSIERQLIRRWITRQLRECEPMNGAPMFYEGYHAALIELRIWLKEQPQRTARKGGIGRR